MGKHMPVFLSDDDYLDNDFWDEMTKNTKDIVRNTRTFPITLHRGRTDILSALQLQSMTSDKKITTTSHCTVNQTKPGQQKAI